MFKNGGFYVNYLLSGFRNQYRGLMRVSETTHHPNCHLTLLVWYVVFGRVQSVAGHSRIRLLRSLPGATRDEGITACRDSFSHSHDNQRRYRPERAADKAFDQNLTLNLYCQFTLS